MKKKKATQQKKPRKNASPKVSTLKRELFCRLYVGYHSRDLFGNGTRSYLEAFGGNERIAKLREEIDTVRSNKDRGYTTEVTRLMFLIEGIEATARTESSKLLTNPDISARCDFLMDTLFTDKFMDRELLFTAGQRYDLPSKVAAIRESNALHNRIQRKAQITDEDGEPITGIAIVVRGGEPAAK